MGGVFKVEEEEWGGVRILWIHLSKNLGVPTLCIYQRKVPTLMIRCRQP